MRPPIKIRQHWQGIDMSLNDEIEDLAKQHQDEFEAIRQADKDRTAAVNAWCLTSVLPSCPLALLTE